ncbi:MAG: hypothetical protein BSOLF_0257 [Candidatus Carbobacillus altaicus]|uniref:DUF4190 domain-containing protein n=1 Tax=Candidatus Carbonibacillus altaicus TaxID=2163959 RepID=A0A2R6Y1B1_9BACL|nr:MAG: hypothetical protein BSOLF_0257 [Candidatus Carbobacillus altaicus]
MDEKRDAYGRDWYATHPDDMFAADDTEFAAEATPLGDLPQASVTESEREQERLREVDRRLERREVEPGGHGLGMTALVVAILGLFIFPLWMGIAAVILGYMAVAAGSRALGWWAIGIGVVAILIALIPFPIFPTAYPGIR